ncbi:MAG: serine hydrolase domain-containing protein [Pseudomonadota bacterium]
MQLHLLARFAFAPLLLLSSASVSPQDINPSISQVMVQTVAAEADTGQFMGAVLVAQGDELVLDQAWGSADLEWGIANTTDTKFRIGSVTKQFTAVSILLLQEQGKLDLDAPVTAYLENAPEAWGAISVRNLLRHTSGIADVTTLDEFAKISRSPVTQDQIFALFTPLPLQFEPGSQWRYSNSNYLALSRIVERVSETSLAVFYRENIFEPLGMEDTRLDVPALILPRRAEGYTPAGEGVIINAPYSDMGIPSGAGAMISTTHDLLKWQRGLFGGAILSSESLAEYTIPSDYDAFPGARYAHGVLVFEQDGSRSLAHGGGIEGFNAWLAYDPDREVTVVVLANINGGAASRLGIRLMELAQSKDRQSP